MKIYWWTINREFDEHYGDVITYHRVLKYCCERARKGAMSADGLIYVEATPYGAQAFIQVREGKSRETGISYGHYAIDECPFCGEEIELIPHPTKNTHASKLEV